MNCLSIEKLYGLERVYMYLFTGVMINEFLNDGQFSSNDKLVVLGDTTTTKQFCLKAKKRGINVKRSTNIEKLNIILSRHKHKINNKNNIYIITDKKYLLWMEVLDNNKIPCKQYVVLPLFLAKGVLKNSK